jgi:hypothetical protein
MDGARDALQDTTVMQEVLAEALARADHRAGVAT